MGDLFNLANGIASVALRHGIAQGGYIAYVETAGSEGGFQYFVTHDGVLVREGNAGDFVTAKQQAEEELNRLCSC